MKQKRWLIPIAAVLAVYALILGGRFYNKTRTINALKQLPPYIREAILAYHDLYSPGEVTWEMLEDITSLRFMYNTCVSVSVNGSLYGTNLGPCILPRRMETLYLERLPEGYARSMFSAFYVNSGEITPHSSPLQRAILDAVPEAKERPMYICDPLASNREKYMLLGYLASYIFTEGEIMMERTLDLACLSVLPNLEYVEHFIDTDFAAEWGSVDYSLTFENCPVEIRTVESVLFDRTPIKNASPTN